MASLEALIKAKLPASSEENLESGRIYSFSEGNTYTKACNCWCWCPTTTGSAVIEVWGAGGSGAKMCCCGNGLPGNSGAYSKTTKAMTALQAAVFVQQTQDQTAVQFVTNVQDNGTLLHMVEM